MHFKGSIAELYPRYSSIFNKEKLPFYEVNKLSTHLKPEQLDLHNTLVAVNKFNIKKGIKLRETLENEDISTYYKTAIQNHPN